ncbi:hypothetical protein BDL97_04G043800 [Sphagnum fallax]|nr:hypothetical protein BDL97_04G043800 [Sphagnum fallax]
MTTVAAGSAIAITVRPAQQTSLFHHSRSFQLAPTAAFKAPHHSSSSSSSIVAVVVVSEQSSRSSLQVRSGRVYSCCSKNFLFLPSLPDAFRGATRQRLTAAARPNSEAIRAAGDSSGMEADQEQEAQQQQQEKWTGGVELTLSCPVESAWAVQSDFLGLHKWAPNILLCELVEGENKKVGCLRHCVGTGTTWVHERLLQFDDDNMYMSYRMEQNHFIFPKGFQGYHSTVQLQDGGEGKTKISWTYSVDPVFSQTKEELTTFMTGFYTSYLKSLETAANSNLITSSNTTSTQDNAAIGASYSVPENATTVQAN